MQKSDLRLVDGQSKGNETVTVEQLVRIGPLTFIRDVYETEAAPANIVHIEASVNVLPTIVRTVVWCCVFAAAVLLASGVSRGLTTIHDILTFVLISVAAVVCANFLVEPAYRVSITSRKSVPKPE